MKLKSNHVEIQIDHTSAFQDCLLRQQEKWPEIIEGLTYGWKGSYGDTTCAETSISLIIQINALLESLAKLQENLLQPFYDTSNLLIQMTNFLTACQFSTQASQLSIRTKTEAGKGDMIYTILQYPVEGYFSTDPLTQNQLWEAFLAIWQGWVGRRSMRCKDVGFQIGRIQQALLSFEIPTQILYSEVNA